MISKPKALSERPVDAGLRGERRLSREMGEGSNLRPWDCGGAQHDFPKDTPPQEAVLWARSPTKRPEPTNNRSEQPPSGPGELSGRRSSDGD